MIGIIVADKNELFYEKLAITHYEKVHQFKLAYFKVNEKQCVIVHAGIGLANAAAATQVLLAKASISVVYNYGAVGAGSALQHYDLIAPQKIFYHDVVTPWYKRGMIPSEAPFYHNDLVLPKNNNLASGSMFVTNSQYYAQLKAELDVDLVDMEAAAIAQICAQNKVPVRIIKCVSDIIGAKTSKTEMINEQIRKAATKAFAVVLDLIASSKQK